MVSAVSAVSAVSVPQRARAYIEYRSCSECGFVKEASAFYKTPARKCKTCVKEKVAKWCAENIAGRRANASAYYHRVKTAKDNSYLRYRRSTKGMLARARQNAKVRGISFSITVADLVVPDRCPVFGAELTWGERRGANTPSIDRIDNAKGYEPGNVWVVSYRANKLKNDATLTELKALVHALEKLEKTTWH